MKMYLVQSELDMSDENYKKFLSANLNLPQSVIDEKINGCQILINEHYFENLYRNCLSKYGPKEVIFNDNVLIDKIMEVEKISVFIYEVCA